MSKENFFYGDRYMNDLESLMEELEIYAEADVLALPEDWAIDIELTNHEYVHQFTKEEIIELVQPDRLSESNDELDDVALAIRNSIDFDKLNSMMPKLHYCNGTMDKITKQDLIDYIS